MSDDKKREKEERGERKNTRDTAGERQSVSDAVSGDWLGGKLGP